MSGIPKIELNQWITVEDRDCVVRRILPENSNFVCEVVYFHLSKVTTNFVSWNGKELLFDRSYNDFGGYARDSEICVISLRKGRYGD